MKLKSWLGIALIVVCTGTLAVAQDASKKEMSPEEKDAVSHRGAAYRQLRAYLQTASS